MYGKTPPLPPPIPNEPPPPSFHPPLPTQPPPSLFQNAAMPVYPLQPRPPATFSNFGYQQQPQLSPYQSMHPQLRVDHQRFNQPKPLFEQSPRPLFDHTRSIHPLMQQSQPLMQQSQPLMQQSQPLMQQSQPLMQQSQPLMQQSQSLMQQSQPLLQQSQPLMQQSQPLLQQSQPLMQQSQPLVQQSQPYNLELRKQTSYQEPSSESSSAGPKPLMDIRPCVPESLSTGEDLGQNVDIARSSEQFSASDAAAINNGNTIVHPVPCHIAPQHQRRTLLPGKPNQWIPPYSSYPSEQDSSSRFDSHSIDYGHSARFDEYQTPEIEEESDHHQPSYHSEPADESNVNKTPIQTVSADVLFGNSDQRTRPTHFVIVLRGLPGSGKSYVAKVIKEKEISNGFSTPRILNLDDYFLVEVEKKVKDPLSGKKVKKKEMEYEYDAAMEEQYRANLFKSFNKTLSDGYFPVIIIDTINHKVSHFYQYWSTAKVRGFEVYVCELDVDIDKCAERNVHKRSLNEIKEIKEEWEEAPPHILRLKWEESVQKTVWHLVAELISG
ncbi:uncharacterized protein [Dysidea avara]|uniref:uncharacterized protein isoform X2 n=1 Tax=Dysidea avara TaxID=196820 RepID=UPI00331ADEBF